MSEPLTEPVDVVVTVPRTLWLDWLAEGDLPGEKWSGDYWSFYCRAAIPGRIELTGESEPVHEALPLAPQCEFHDHLWHYVKRGQRCYVVSHGRLRGYAPLYALETEETGRELRAFIRRGGAVAVTIPQQMLGFRGWRYRWWSRSEEAPFEGWREVS